MKTHIYLQLDPPDEFTQILLDEYEDSPNALRWEARMRAGVERAYSDHPFCEIVLKLLSFFNMKTIPADLIVTLIEEIDPMAVIFPTTCTHVSLIVIFRSCSTAYLVRSFYLNSADAHKD